MTGESLEEILLSCSGQKPQLRVQAELHSLQHPNLSVSSAHSWLTLNAAVPWLGDIFSNMSLKGNCPNLSCLCV